MGEAKDINDLIYDRLLSRLYEEGYENIESNVNNKIVDLINPSQQESEEFEDLVKEAIKIIKNSNNK